MDQGEDSWLAVAARHLDVAALHDAEIAALLDAARDVAHHTERRFAPLSCFLLGVAAARGREDIVDIAGELAALARAQEPADD